MISSKNDYVIIQDLCDLTIHIIYDAWWASMNVGSNQSIAWNNSRHAPLSRFYLHCGIEETGGPSIICIVCHQVLRHPSEHVTSSIGTHLLGKGHIAKLNELTVSEVTELTSSTVDETALGILMRQGSRGILIVSSQRKFKFTIQVSLNLLNWQTKRSKLAAKYFPTAEFHQDTGNCYLMFGFVSAQIASNAISKLELPRSYNALRSELVLPSAGTLKNICRREYTLTLDAIKKQLPSRNNVSSALDGWTLMNTLAISSVSTYYMDRGWDLREVHLTFEKVDSPLISYFETWLRITDAGSAYGITASQTF